jgi:DNA-binding transcriptional MerR regulator
MRKNLLVSQAAEIMNCHPETIRRLNRRGVLKAKRDYRGFRIFNLEEILKIKKQREQLSDGEE